MRVAIADDSALLRQGLARLLADDGCEVVATVGDAAALVRAIELDSPDAVIVDIRMPPTHTDEGIVAAQAIRERHPAVAILVLSSYLESEYATRLLDEVPARAGYLLKERVSDVGVVHRCAAATGGRRMRHRPGHRVPAAPARVSRRHRHSMR